MSATLELREGSRRLGFKGPRAGDWLAEQGIALPAMPNTWTRRPVNSFSDGLLVARLGSSEFFLERDSDGDLGLGALFSRQPPGVYPVLREDWAFLLDGDGVHEVLAQVCNVDFAELSLESQPLIMTLMIGVAVLVVPETAGEGRRYRIWCDPTFGPYLRESLGVVVVESGGRYKGASA